ncbi:hypothetical protein V8B97DRAFT_554968 [Scleroderma yunnanense]
MSGSPENPFDDTSFLLSSVETIKDSVEDCSSVSFHDLLDAYNTLSNRLEFQRQFPILQNDAAHFPAFECIIRHKAALLEALRRDISLAHTDSIDVRSRPFEDFFSNTTLPDSKLDPMQRARNSSLCNYALCALASIFKYPSVFSLFTVAELAELFMDVVNISLTRTLPVFDSAKIYSSSLGILRSHCLPLAVVIPHRVDLVTTLRYSLQAREQPDTARDGLEVVIHILDHYTKDLFGTMAELLPLVLDYLLSESTELCLLASGALSRLATLLIHEPEGIPKQDRRTASIHIFNFLYRQAVLSDEPDGERTFVQVVRAVFGAQVQTSPEVGPTWMVSVLASLIVLCGPKIFSEHHTLEFLLGAVAAILVHRDGGVRALHACVWRCLIWVYARLLADLEDLDFSVVDMAFRAVKQELSGGMGIIITSILLGGRDTMSTSLSRMGTRLNNAMSIIRCMVHGECARTKKDGFALLRALSTTNSSVGDGGSSKGLDDILPAMLFDGTVVHAQWDKLPTMIRRIPRFTIDDVPPLTATEVSSHFKALFDSWRRCMPQSSSEQLDPTLVDVWKSLLYLLVQTLTTPREAFNYAARSLTRCLLSPLHDSDGQSNPESQSVRDQNRLIAIEDLWSAMKDVSTPSCFTEPAQLILSAIIKYGFNVLNPEVRCIWNALCVDLMLIASAPFLGIGPILPESLTLVKKHRELWGSVASSLAHDPSNLHWEIIVELLCIPVRAWVLSEWEVGIWGSLLQFAKASSKDWCDVIEKIVDQVGGRDTEKWETIAQAFTIILSSFKENGQFPPNIVMDTIDGVLTCAYGRGSIKTGSSEHVRLFVALRDHIVASTPEDVIKVLIRLRTSLNLWIGDEMEIMEVDDFNSVVIPLYCDTLKVLERLPLSQEALHDMESFLASGFSRIPTPAVAPFAFEKFWRATYFGQTQFYNDIPPKVKDCLTCFVAAFGGDLAYGLSDSSQSQSQDLLAPLMGVDGVAEPHVSIIHGCHSLPQISHVGDSLCRHSLVKRPSFSNHAEAQRNERFAGDATVEQEEDIPSIVDTTFIFPSSDDRPDLSALSKIHRHASQDEPLNEEIDDCQQLLSASILYGLPYVLAPLGLDVQRGKRARTPEDYSPRKRGRNSLKIPTNFRKTKSEPVSRTNTLLPTISRYSAPVPSKAMMLDCVEVPTLRSILERERMLRSQRTPEPEVRLSPTSCAPSAVRTGYLDSVSCSPLPPSVSSEDDEDPWHDPRRLERTSSEIVVDESLAQIHPSSPPRSQGATVPNSDTYDPGGTSRQIRSQTEALFPGSNRVPLRRSKNSSAKLDVLQDAYVAVMEDASQISVTDLVRARTLVHQISAALNEQIGKRFGTSN